MKKKFLVIIMALALFATMSVTVYADEQEVATEPEEYSYEYFMNQFKQMDSGEFYNALNSIDTSSFSKLEWDVPSGIESKALLDLQYNNLVADFEKKGFGQTTELQVPEFNAGYSGSITDRFTETFGDLSDKQLPEISLPEGWNMQSIMSSAKEQRDSLASEFTQSQKYKDVVNSISISSLFDDAQDTLKKPALMDNYSLKLRVQMRALDGKITSGFEYADDCLEIAKASIETKVSMDSGLSEDMEDLFQSEVAKSKAQINELSAAEEKAALDVMLDDLKSTLKDYEEEKEEDRKQIIGEQIEEITGGAISSDNTEPKSSIGYAYETMDEIIDQFMNEDELTDEISDALRNGLINAIEDALSG